MDSRQTGVFAWTAARRRPRREHVLHALRAATATALLAPMIGALAAGTAQAAVVNGAVFSGGAGTYSNGGTLYAKAGAELELTVTTAPAKCVQVTKGTASALLSSDTDRSHWIFNKTQSPSIFTASGELVQTVTVEATSNYNGNQVKCTGNSDTRQASYIGDNTGPVVTGSLAPSPNAAGWNNSDVTINWTASDAGSGVASGAEPAVRDRDSGHHRRHQDRDRDGPTGQHR